MKNGDTTIIGIPTKKCAKCGKKFVPAPYHVYVSKRERINEHTKWYCGCSCYNHRNDKK